jgi:cardiolipin synthase
MTSRILFVLFLGVAACSAASTDSADSSGPGGASSGGPGSGGDGSVTNGSGPASSANATSTGTGEGGTTKTSTEVSIIVEPNGNHASELVNAIKAATTSVYMTMYQIDNPTIIAAIKDRESAGLAVKIVLDGSSTNKSFNTPAFNAFNAIHPGTAVWSSSTFTLTHEKCVILDAKEAWIMTMNLNKSSPDDDREFLAIDDDAADVAEATAIFSADYTSSSVTPTGNLVVANNNARPDLVALIGTATKSLDIEVEEFSDTNQNGIVDAVVAVAASGIPVRIVIANASLDSTGPTANTDVINAGGKVVKSGGTSSGSTTANPYIAAKTILIDCVTGTCARGYVGSENLTAASLGHNRELGVILSDSTELAKIYSAMSTDFSHGTPE